MEKARITKNNTNTSKEYTFYRARTIQQPFKTFWICMPCTCFEVGFHCNKGVRPVVQSVHPLVHHLHIYSLHEATTQLSGFIWKALYPSIRLCGCSDALAQQAFEPCTHESPQWKHIKLLKFWLLSLCSTGPEHFCWKTHGYDYQLDMHLIWTLATWLRQKAKLVVSSRCIGQSSKQHAATNDMPHCLLRWAMQTHPHTPSNNDLQLCPLACATCQWRLMCGNWSAISYLQNLLCETCLCTKHASIGMCFRCLFGESWSWSWCLMKFHPKHEQAHMMQKQLYIYM